MSGPATGAGSLGLAPLRLAKGGRTGRNPGGPFVTPSALAPPLRGSPGASTPIRSAAGTSTVGIQGRAGAGPRRVTPRWHPHRRSLPPALLATAPRRWDLPGRGRSQGALRTGGSPAAADVPASFGERPQAVPPLWAGVREGLFAAGAAGIPVTVLTEGRLERCRALLSAHGLLDSVSASSLSARLRPRTSRSGSRCLEKGCSWLDTRPTTTFGGGSDRLRPFSFRAGSLPTGTQGHRRTFSRKA